MGFSDLVHRFETDVKDVLLPTDQPSDTREAEALAKAAEGVAVTVDPELEPIFGAIGAAGDAIEGHLGELGKLVGQVKAVIAKRAQSVVPPPSVPAGEAPVGTPVGDTPPVPPPAAADSDASSTEPAADDDAPVTVPGTSVPPPSTPVSESDVTATVPSSTPPTDGETSESTPSPAPTSEPDEATAAAEAAFSALTPDEQAGFEATEGLEPEPPAAT
jgi:hypothetical protein